MQAAQHHIRETLPESLLQKQKLLNKKEALNAIHIPQSHEQLAEARHRLKFEELFYIQLRLIKMKLVRQEKFRGIVFSDTAILTKFYKDHLPFASHRSTEASDTRDLYRYEKRQADEPFAAR